MEPSMILSVMPTEETALNNNTAEQALESCAVVDNGAHKHSALDRSVKNGIFSLICEAYPEILVVLAAISVFIETLHDNALIFQLHVYIYFYLLGIGIIIFLSSFIIQFVHKLSQANSCSESTINTHSAVGSYKLGLIVSGLAACLSSCLESVSVLSAPPQCSKASYQTFSVMCTCYLALQMLFILINLRKVNTFQWFHKLVVLHIISTNAALWLRNALFASSSDWQEATHIKYNSTLKWGQNEINISMHSLEYDTTSENQSLQVPKHAVHVTSNCWWKVPIADVANEVLTTNLCLRNSSYGATWWQISQISYPVEMQFYILASIVLFVSWKGSISFKHARLPFHLRKFQLKWCALLFSKGFFFGSIIFLSVAIFAMFHEVKKINLTVVTIFSCVLFGVSSFASILGLMQSDIQFHTPELNKDQKFVMICLRYGLYLVYFFCSFDIFVGVIVKNLSSFLLLLQSVLKIIHGVIQYVLIKLVFSVPNQCDSKIRLKQVLIFLVFCNASFWVLECITFWNDFQRGMHLEVYGSAVWPIIKRILLPCMGFYRIHSAAMLTEAWRTLNIRLH